MTEVTFKFNTEDPDELYSYRVHSQSERLIVAVSAFDRHLRSLLKYGTPLEVRTEYDVEELPTVEKIQDDLRRFLDKYEAKLDLDLRL